MMLASSHLLGACGIAFSFSSASRSVSISLHFVSSWYLICSAHLMAISSLLRAWVIDPGFGSGSIDWLGLMFMFRRMVSWRYMWESWLFMLFSFGLLEVWLDFFHWSGDFEFFFEYGYDLFYEVVD